MKTSGRNGDWSRRDLLRAIGAPCGGMGFLCPAPAAAVADPSRLAIPGLYPGRVVGVEHPGSIVSGVFQAAPIQQMMYGGMRELTEAPDWTSAWRQFFGPGDVVGIKLNGVGKPRVVSCREVVNLIIDGLTSAGVGLQNIVVYDRYRTDFVGAGFDKWLPAGVQTCWAAEAFDSVQQSLEGYDPNYYVDLPLILPGQDPAEPAARRSYAAQFITQQVHKLVNLALLKDHQAAGVSLSLKNLSHGLANNAQRSHISTTSMACNAYIPAVVAMPVIRTKAVLHILDGIKGVFHGGPGAREQFVWQHYTLYFATDPVALDRIGWKQIDRQRLAAGMLSVADAVPDRYSIYHNRQPDHIEMAGALGLGVSDEAKIDYRQLRLS
jgi:hypothetical protein